MKKSALLVCYLFLSYFVWPQEKELLRKEWEKMSGSKTALFKKYNDLKFGMFIHWGVYSKLGGTWQGVKIVPETHGAQATLGEWIMSSAKISRKAYREVAKKFNPVGFNAEEWVSLAKEAGMKYIVVMPKHHDGFAMYHSKVSGYNIYDLTSFKRDPMEEIYQACQKHGLRMGIYYSHSIDWMDGGDGGLAQEKKVNPGFTNTEASNSWDPSPVTYQQYIQEKGIPQMKELLAKFPGLVEIYYDYPNYMNLQQSFEFYKLAYDYQPGCLVNSRVGNDLGDMLTAGDNEIPTEIQSNYKSWETPGTMNNTWGYKSYDNDWKSLDEMIFWIVEIASKGGNYLLNIGPDGNGKIPAKSVKILKDIGAWMKINGEAIYGTTRWTTMKEGPTNLQMKSTTDRKANGFSTVFTNEDFWFTAKDNFVYIISLTSASGNSISCKSLFNYSQKIKSIRRLGDQAYLKWEVSGDRFKINMPPDGKKNLPGFVLRVELL